MNHQGVGSFGPLLILAVLAILVTYIWAKQKEAASFSDLSTVSLSCNPTAWVFVVGWLSLISMMLFAVISRAPQEGKPFGFALVVILGIALCLFIVSEFGRKISINSAGLDVRSFYLIKHHHRWDDILSVEVENYPLAIIFIFPVGQRVRIQLSYDSKRFLPQCLPHLPIRLTTTSKQGIEMLKQISTSA